MNIKLFGIFIFIVVTNAYSRRLKREAFALPDGVNLLVPEIRTTFQCPGDGYYADVDNNCQLFHVCHGFEEGSSRAQQWTFVCGNQTVFNQLTFTCAYPDEAVACENAPEFYYLNNHVQQGDPEIPFLNDQDVQNAAAFVPGDRRYGAKVPAAPPASGGPRPGRG